MKNLKQTLLICAGIILTGLIAVCNTACSNPFEPSAFNAGTGNVLISIAGGTGRTILPAADDFSRYTLEVTGENNPTAPTDLSGLTGSGVSMTLLAGEYTITVKAYRTSGEDEHLAAQGSATVTVSSGSVDVVIDLKPFIGTGNGFFTYRITLPAEATAATMNLSGAEGGYDEDFNLMESSASSAPIALSAGYYDLFISLAKGAEVTGEYAAVHIYSGMETSALIDLSNGFALINLETLHKVIEDAEAALAMLEDGDDIIFSDDGTDVAIGSLWVTQAAADALQAALETAQGVVENPPNKQREVDSVRQALEAALAAFGPRQGTNFEGSWTGFITEVRTPVTFTLTGGAWSHAVPLANVSNVTGTYAESDGTITFNQNDDTFATGILSPADHTLTVTLTAAVLGENTVTLTKGPAPTPAVDIEYLYSGIWTDTETTAATAAISSDKWTFSLPYQDVKAAGKFRVYDRKAAFFTADGAFFAVGNVAVEEAELTGNTLTVYPLAGGSYDVTLNPYPIPFTGNWLGGDTVGGTLYVGITTWTLEDETEVLAGGEYVWEDDTAYLISNGVRFATARIEGNTLTVTLNSGDTQVFTLIPSPFLGNWRATIALIVNIDAAVTANTYAITSIAGNANGQYTWRVVGSTNTAYFYSNGHPYGVATQTTATRIVVALEEPITAPIIGTISSLTMNKR